jgi:hypothetical protein
MGVEASQQLQHTPFVHFFEKAGSMIQAVMATW